VLEALRRQLTETETREQVLSAQLVESKAQLQSGAEQLEALRRETLEIEKAHAAAQATLRVSENTAKGHSDTISEQVAVIEAWTQKVGELEQALVQVKAEKKRRPASS